MNDNLSIGYCEKCGRRLTPADFNVHGAVRHGDGTVYCQKCALAPQTEPGKPKPKKRSDTTTFQLINTQAAGERRDVDITCPACSKRFGVKPEGLPKYVFCTECGKKLRVAAK